MKILIIPPFGMGDNLMMLPLAYNLKKQIKNCEIHFLSAKSNCAKDLVNLSTYVDKVIIFNLKRYLLLDITNWFLSKYLSLIIRLNKENYDYVVTINPNFVRSIIINSILARKLVSNNLKENQIKTSLNILKALGLREYRDWGKLLYVDKKIEDKTLKRFGLVKEKYILFNLYGQEAHRTYSGLIKLFTDFKSNYKNVAIGLRRGHISINKFDLVNKTNPEELVALINNSKLLITVDGGIMHIGNSLNKKVLAIFSNNPSKYFKPLNDKKFYCIDTNKNRVNLKSGFNSRKNYLKNLPIKVVENKIRFLLKHEK